MKYYGKFMMITKSQRVAQVVLETTSSDMRLIATALGIRAWGATGEGWEKLVTGLNNGVWNDTSLHPYDDSNVVKETPGAIAAISEDDVGGAALTPGAAETMYKQAMAEYFDRLAKNLELDEWATTPLKLRPLTPDEAIESAIDAEMAN